MWHVGKDISKLISSSASAIGQYIKGRFFKNFEWNKNARGDDISKQSSGQAENMPQHPSSVSTLGSKTVNSTIDSMDSQTNDDLAVNNINSSTKLNASETKRTPKPISSHTSTINLTNTPRVQKPGREKLGLNQSG